MLVYYNKHKLALISPIIILCLYPVSQKNEM